MEYASDVLSLCATGRYELQGRTPYEAVMNYTPDISEYATFSWFQWCYYFDEQTRSKMLCRWLGPAHGIGQSFCSYILLDNGEFIARSSVTPVPEADLTTDHMKTQLSKFMINVENKIGNSNVPIYDVHKPTRLYSDLFYDDDDVDDNILPYGDELHDMKMSDVD